MGVAFDEEEDGNIKVTTQVYKPVQTSGNQATRQGPAFVNIETSEKTVFQSIRSIPNNLGRRTQWSHQQILIISEKFARTHNIKEVLDFFIRDHEPRLNSYLLITKDEARTYLETEPHIENTVSQEFKQAIRSSAEISARTVDMTLLKVFLDLRSETENTVIPYFITSGPTDKTVEGVALIQNGKMIDTLTSVETEDLVMLMNEYINGIIEVPCLNNENMMETLEVILAETKIETTPKADSISGHIKTKLDVIIGELNCSDLGDEEAEKLFIETVQDTLKQRLKKTLKKLQEQKVDVLGIGNQVYRKDPRLWKDIKEEWDEHFARTSFDIEVEVRISDSGMFISKPSF